MKTTGNCGLLWRRKTVKTKKNVQRRDVKGKGKGRAMTSYNMLRPY